MNKLSSIIFFSFLALSGCLHEQTVFGVRESVWNGLTPAQQDAVMLNYQRQQEIKQQQAPLRAIINSTTELLEREQALRAPHFQPSSFAMPRSKAFSTTMPLSRKNNSSSSQSSQSYYARDANSITHGYKSSSTSHSSSKSNSVSMGFDPAGALNTILDALN